MRCLFFGFLVVLLVSHLLVLGQPLSVQLEWDPNPPSDDIAGYNLYRSNQPGFGFVRLNVTLIPSNIYTDDTIEAGHTYYYVCTAENTSELESGFSNEVLYTARLWERLSGRGQW